MALAPYNRLTPATTAPSAANATRMKVTATTAAMARLRFNAGIKLAEATLRSE